ncbi:MAG: hypothetical protein V4450_07435 [Bacteroidota bacterium]
MKKVILILLIAAGVFAAPKVQAQVDLTSVAYGNTKDTVTNTATKVLYAKVTGFKETVTIIASLTKISGTLGGTLKLVVSHNGTTWYDASGYSASDTAFTVTDVTAQGKAFQCKKGFQYYGVQWTGTGTMSGSFTAVLLARKSTD